jgi:hypothetical protein
MGKFSDIFFMVLGIVLLLLTLSGAADIGPWGFIASIACIGFGVAAMYKMRLAGKALKSELLQDQRVVDCYNTTLAAWSSGQLDVLSEKFRKEGAMAYDKFVAKYRPIEGSALFVFFSQFPPRPGEFIIGIGNGTSSTDSAWFVLTNLRLIQRDGRDRSFTELDLADIHSFEFKGKWTKQMTFNMISGKPIDFAKVDIYPSEKFLTELIKRARLAEVVPQTGSPAPPPAP